MEKSTVAEGKIFQDDVIFFFGCSFSLLLGTRGPTRLVNIHIENASLEKVIKEKERRGWCDGSAEKALAAKPSDLCSISGSHKVEGETGLRLLPRGPHLDN